MPETTFHRHLGAYAIISRGDTVLLVEKCRGPYTGCWDVPGGGIEDREGPDDALRRELREETGLQLESAALSTVADIHCCHRIRAPHPEHLRHTALIYRASTNMPERPRMPNGDGDVCAVRWTPVDACKDVKLSPVARAGLRAVTGREEWTTQTSGTLTAVRTNGRHVRRPLRRWSPATHALLQHLEERNVPGVPRFVAATDEEEILSYLAGQPLRRPWPEVLQSTTWMETLGRWLRTLHDATADFRLPDGTAFAWGPGRPDAQHVVNHGDFGPWNTLADQGAFAGVIDWDLARFGRRLDGLVEAAFEFGPLRQNRAMLDDASGGRILARLDALCSGYGQRFDPTDILERVEAWLDGRIDAISELAARNRTPFVTLVDHGVLEDLRRDLAHVRRLDLT